MVGDKYWSTGITVWHTGVGADFWAAKAEFFDGGFCDGMASEGEIRARYVGPLAAVVDLVKADAERLGIQWGALGDGGTIYYRGDGEHADIPGAPADWRERVNAEARRIGWHETYALRTPAEPSSP